MRRVVTWIVLCIVAGLPGAAGYVDESCERVVAIGDIHGGYEAFVTGLQMTALVDDELKWIGHDACFVQLGDMLDRGDDTQELLDLMMDLEAQAPERIHFLLGNHEVMNLEGDLRYVSGGDYASFAGEESENERRRGLREFKDLPNADDLTEQEAQKVFDKDYPPGWFARREAFSLHGRYGKWLLGHPALLRIHGTLFVHGGVGPNEAALGLDRLNDKVTREIRDYNQMRDRLVRSGALNPLVSYADSFAAVRKAYNLPLSQLSPNTGPEILLIAQRFLRLRNPEVTGTEGPLWSRYLGDADEELAAGAVSRTLDLFGVSRIVAAHTPNVDGRIHSRFGDRVFLIDTGAGPTYTFGGISALEIVKDGPIRAIYPDRVESLAFAVPSAAAAQAPGASAGGGAAGPATGRPGPSDEDLKIEQFLREGTVVSVEEIGSGITKPKRVVLEYNGERRRAAFKYLDDQRSGLTRFGPGHAELNFTDRYIYERAAYLLDRDLGIHMVPPTVIREIEGQPGALTDWVEDAIDESKRSDEALEPEPLAPLLRQRDLMRVFDALIDNSDRNRGNMLYTLSDWKLHLIDHSRAFRNSRKLSEEFAARVVSVPRDVYERLKNLDEKALRDEMKSMLSRVQLGALFRRRDKILSEIDKDVAQYGEKNIFYDREPAAAE